MLQEVSEHAEKNPGTLPEQLLWDLKVHPALGVIASSCTISGRRSTG